MQAVNKHEMSEQGVLAIALTVNSGLPRSLAAPAFSS